MDLLAFNGATVILSNARLMNQEPNSKLIAAAPELLEALEDLIAQFSGADFLQKAHAAIAKATGEQK